MKNVIQTTLIGAILVAGASIFANPALALQPLSQDKHINDRLIAARIADRVRRTCPSIEGRVFYAYGEARKLQRYALDRGYTRAQIDAFLDSRQEKNRIYAIADDYLRRNGVREGDAQTYCAAGRQEIANGSYIGSFLVTR